MRFLVLAGCLLFIGVGSAQAQSSFGALGNNVGGGSSLNSAGSLNHAGEINFGGSSGSSSLPDTQQPRRNVEATNPGEFVPSTFENYDTALNMGQDATHARPLSVADAARMAQKARAAATTKPAIRLEKDAEGKLVIVEAKN